MNSASRQPPAEPPPVTSYSRWRAFFSRLRIRLLLLVLLAILPVLGLVVYSGVVQREEARDNAQKDQLRKLRMVADAQREQIEATRQLLRALSTFTQMQPENADTCQMLFRDLLPLHRVYENIGAIDTRGYLFASGLPEMDRSHRISLGNRAFFQRVTNTLRSIASDYQLDHKTGKASLTIAFPVKDSSEANLRAVVFAVLDLNWINHMAARSYSLEGSSLMVVDAAGSLLLRYPDSSKTWFWQTLKDHPVVQHMLVNRQSTGQGSAPDGEKLFFATAPLSTTGGIPDAWVVSSIPAGEVFALSHRLLLQNLTILVFVALLVLALAWYGGNWFVLRQVRALVHTTQRLTAGDLKARTGLPSGPGELSQLAHHFDTMAQSLEQRIAERGRAETKLRQLNEELEQRVAERTLELRRSNEELEQFAYVASHDLQEPLRMVTNYMQLLQQRYRGALDANAHDFIGFAVDGATRMQRLINDLLTYSRVGTKRRPFEQTDCEEVLARALKNLELTLQDAQAVVTHAPLPRVLGDATQLTQLFQNLISNGVRFHGSQPPAVHLAAQRIATPGSAVAGAKSEWQFSVRDNGIGIAPENFERIFVIFQRLHARDKYPGTGIGLSICKKIVERHGGRIWLESQIGTGTTFYFTLPSAS